MVLHLAEGDPAVPEGEQVTSRELLELVKYTLEGVDFEYGLFTSSREVQLGECEVVEAETGVSLRLGFVYQEHGDRVAEFVVNADQLV